MHEIAYQYGKNVGLAFQVGPLLCKSAACWSSGQGGGDTGMVVLVTALSPFPANR